MPPVSPGSHGHDQGRGNTAANHYEYNVFSGKRSVMFALHCTQNIKIIVLTLKQGNDNNESSNQSLRSSQCPS